MKMGDLTKPLIYEMRVPSCDVDSFGHVNNSIYLRYLEAARNEYMLRRGLVFADFERWGAGPVLISAKLEFKQPCHTDDELAISGALSRRGHTRFRIFHEVLRSSDRILACRAELEFAWVQLASGRPCRIPPDFIRAFALEE